MENFDIALGNVLADKYGRVVIRAILADCGVDIANGISYRGDKTAHEFGLELLHKIMYNDIDKLKLMISEQKTLEVNNGRGSRDADD
jgi:hypothetical protein